MVFDLVREIGLSVVLSLIDPFEMIGLFLAPILFTVCFRSLSAFSNALYILLILSLHRWWCSSPNG